MVPAARWLLVLAVAVVLAGVPVLVRAWPVEPSGLSAAQVADAVRGSYDTGWSGEVRSQGAVEIPESDSQLDGVARLLGESSTLRVWWRSPDELRVDRVRPSGETDLLRAGDLSVRWRYEGNRVSVTFDDDLRLPDDPDVLPVALARRLLAGADDAELSRLPDERVAGRAAAGLRLVPADPRSSIARVDLWADQVSGVPLRVAVYAAGDASPALSSEVTDLDLRRPTAQQVRIEFSRGVEVSRSRGFDAARGDLFSLLPQQLGGLPLRDDAEAGDAGVYGRGPTTLSAVPVRGSVARDLRAELRRLAATVDTGARQSVAFGPVSVVLTSVGEQDFLLVGTVTLPTLQRAADDLGGER